MNVPSTLLKRFLPEVQESKGLGPTLDLACGKGRNGLYLANLEHPIIFLDRDSEQLQEIEMQLIMEDWISACRVWQVDLEVPEFEGLPENQYGCVMVFRYLHRALFDQIKASVVSGGLVIYETFTVHQAEYGRPKNPDFLLKDNELQQVFCDWEILHSYEGRTISSDGVTPQAIAQIVARKP